MALKLKPDYADVYTNLGSALVQKGEMKEAVHHFRETLRHKSDLLLVQKNLEFALLRSKELEWSSFCSFKYNFPINGDREQPIVTFIPALWGLAKSFAREALDGQT